MFIDTSGFLCRYVKTEILHNLAVEMYDSATACVTSSYVLAEYTALAHIRGIPREEIINFSSRILSDEAIEIIWVDNDLHRSGIDLMAERADKSYSLCDAVSFVIMRERSIADALTTDKHFEQEGFLRMLK
ncbi:MAG: type II toxin-antitoxin system VapC family toxin [Pyrinomonadaceae bacterium]